MTRAGLAAVLALVVLAVAWTFGRLDAPETEGRARVVRSPAPRRSPAAPPPTPAAATDLTADHGVPARDLFVYADDELAQRPALIVLETPPAPTPAATPEPPAVRLVGLVGRAGRQRAALAMNGQVLVAGVGDAAGDVRVLAIDEDRGVHVRLADGREIWLRHER